MSLAGRLERLPAAAGHALAAGAGAALPLAFAPFDWFWIAPVSLAVPFVLWRFAPRPGAALKLGLVYGLAAFLAGVHWVYVSLHDFGEIPVPISVLLTGGFVAILAAYAALAGWVAARFFAGAGRAAFLLGVAPALWVVVEWCRGWLFSGFGWLAVGYSQTDSWLMGFASVLGQHGMSWAVALTAGALGVLALGARRERIVAAAAIAVVWGTGYALGTQRWTEPTADLVSVALAQGAVTQDLKWDPDLLEPTMALYARLTGEAEGADLIVWPEAAIPEWYSIIEPWLADVGAAARGRGAVVLLGVLKYDPPSGRFHNALVALTDPPSTYFKRHLVPFGEYYPVPAFVRPWLALGNIPSITDALPGDAYQAPLVVDGQRIAVTICYEDVFGAEQLHYMPDATLLVNVSNDAWFGDSIAPHQHLQIARLRAAEVGRYLLRSTNTGITAVIDPSGRVTRRLPQFEAGVLRDTVQGFTGLTPYARLGNWPVLIGALAVLVLGFRRGTLRRG